MIKLIVSDMDGTLLKKGEKKVSEEIKNYIFKIKKKGIKFAVASGRQYEELLYLTDYMEDIYYICSDGGCIVYNGEVIYKREIDLSFYSGIKEDMIFHAPLKSYYLQISDKLNKELENYKGSIEKTQNLCDIVKISAFGGRFFEKPDFTYEVYKDKSWTEWIKNDGGKGQAVEYLKKSGIKADEIAVIGDNFNDMGMMRCSKHRFAIEGCPNQVKMLCGNRSYKTEDIFKRLLEEDINE